MFDYFRQICKFKNSLDTISLHVRSGKCRTDSQRPKGSTGTGWIWESFWIVTSDLDMHRDKWTGIDFLSSYAWWYELCTVLFIRVFVSFVCTVSPFPRCGLISIYKKRMRQTKLAECLLLFALFGFSSQSTCAENHGACRCLLRSDPNMSFLIFNFHTKVWWFHFLEIVPAD